MANSNESETCKSNATVPVELGFVQRSPSWILKSKFFRSKVGGKPAWLGLENLPDTKQLQCKNCTKPCSFLLQVYAPLDDVEEAFHRTIFLFMCMDGKCCKRFSSSNVQCFRSQLPRRNQFYSFEPPEEVDRESDVPSASQFLSLCEVCGCRGDSKYDDLPDVSFCGQDHRDAYIKAGFGVDKGVKKKKKQKYSQLLPEYELVTDTEELPPPSTEKSDEEKMREYKQFLQSAKAKDCMQDGQLEDVEHFIKKPDKLFNKFQKRVALEPDQVLRYQRGGSPLWVSSEHVPSSSDIPDCSCGAPRIFEFQVMPQLLNHLKLDAVGDSVDWGSLICYTCSKSCNQACTSYVEEFVWKQDFSDDNDKP